MGFFQRLRARFSKKNKDQKSLDLVAQKNSQGFWSRFWEARAKHKEMSAKFIEEFEELLISFDISYKFVSKISSQLEKELKKNKNPIIEEIVAQKLFENFTASYRPRKLTFENKPMVYLVLGVNGSGKTSTCIKLANFLKKQNKKVLLVAADTFRAAAVGQLEMMASKIGVEIFKDENQRDPAAVVYKALDKDDIQDFDVVIIDTAGRLHNKTNLVNELAKIKKIVSNKIQGAPHESFLILDAVAGQNSLLQTEVFKEAIGVTSIILTKLDGTSKGGVIFNIQESFETSPMFATIGEGVEDIIEFDLEWYVYSLLKPLNKSVEEK